MIKIRNATTEGLEDLLETLAKLKIHPQRIVLSSLFNRHDSYELVDGELVETIDSVRPRIGNKNLPPHFYASPGEFGNVGYTSEGYVIDAELVDESGTLHLVIQGGKYLGLELNMTAPIKIDGSEPVFIRDLLPSIYGVGMTFDLSDKSIRDFMRKIADKRIPVQYFAPGDNKSTMYGDEGKDGKYDIRIDITLQKPGSRYLDCYVASLLSERQEGGKLTTTQHAEGVPESKWQADEGHYCITDENRDSYPLVPIEFDKIRRITLQLETVIHEWEESEKPLFTVTGDVPLTLGKPNEFYARGFLGPGHFFEVRRFPNHDIVPDAAILYRRPSSLANVVGDLHSGMQELQSIKRHLEGVFNN